MDISALLKEMGEKENRMEWFGFCRHEKELYPVSLFYTGTDGRWGCYLKDLNKIFPSLRCRREYSLCRGSCTAMAAGMDSDGKAGIFNGTVFKRKRGSAGKDFLFLLGKHTNTL